MDISGSNRVYINRFYPWTQPGAQYFRSTQYSPTYSNFNSAYVRASAGNLGFRPWIWAVVAIVGTTILGVIIAMAIIGVLSNPPGSGSNTTTTQSSGSMTGQTSMPLQTGTAVVNTQGQQSQGTIESMTGQPTGMQTTGASASGTTAATPTCDTSVNLLCPNGNCVKFEFICDGADDCGDGDDEANCTCEPPINFKCNSSQCIIAEWQCDGFPDCQDRSDESNCVCTEEQYKCPNSGRCISNLWLCDGENDCLTTEPSDEANCEGVTQNPAAKIVIPPKVRPKQ